MAVLQMEGPSGAPAAGACEPALPAVTALTQAAAPARRMMWLRRRFRHLKLRDPRYSAAVMSSKLRPLSDHTRRRPLRRLRLKRGLVAAALSGATLLLTAGGVSATGHEAPQSQGGAVAAVAGSGKTAGKSVTKGLAGAEQQTLERSERVRELRRQLREHNRQWRAGAAARPTPVVSSLTETSSPVQEAILPAMPARHAVGPATLAEDAMAAPGTSSASSSSTSSSSAFPLSSPSAASPSPFASTGLPAASNSVPLTDAPAEALAGTAHRAASLSSTALDPASTAPTASTLSTAGDSRLTELERSLLRQQLRQLPQASSVRGDRELPRH